MRWMRAKNALEVLTYRDGSDPIRDFLKLGADGAAALRRRAPAAPRTVVVLFDTSLSMQWEKLERSFQALESLLRSLRPADRFNLLVFNEQGDAVRACAGGGYSGGSREGAGVSARGAIARGNQLAGGARRGAGADIRATILISWLLGDLGATRGILQNGKLANGTRRSGSRSPEARRPRTYVFAVGDDANLPLGRMLARNHGVFECGAVHGAGRFQAECVSVEDRTAPVDGLQLGITPAANFDLIYPLEESVFPGSMQTWVGRI